MLHLPVQGIIGGGDFSPPDLPNLVLWLDASDATVLFQNNSGDTGNSPVTADGQTVANWTDKSGNLNNVFQNGGGNEPEYKTGIQNGLSILRAAQDDATPEFLERFSSVLSQDANVTLFWVAKLVVDETLGCVYSNTDVSGLPQLAVYADARSAENRGVLLEDSTATVKALLPSDIGTEFNQFTGIVDSATTITARLNGVAGTPVAIAGDGVTTNDYTRIFNQAGGFGSLAGDIAEVVIYDGLLLTADIETVEAYLKDKWATP